MKRRRVRLMLTGVVLSAALGLSGVAQAAEGETVIGTGEQSAVTEPEPAGGSERALGEETGEGRLSGQSGSQAAGGLTGNGQAYSGRTDGESADIGQAYSGQTSGEPMDDDQLYGGQTSEELADNGQAVSGQAAADTEAPQDGEELQDPAQPDKGGDAGESVPPAVLHPAPEGVHHGWYYYDDGWYYYSADGKLVSGWIKLKNIWYYLDGADTQTPYRMASGGRKVIGGHTYFFRTDGTMLTGWVNYGGKRYYTDASGAMVTGWKSLNGKLYYFDGANAEAPGAACTEKKKTIGSDTYFFGADGARLTGWVWVSGWYYADADGTMATGWRKLSGKWYYLDGANEEHPGQMVSGCRKEIGGHTYFFKADGTMLTGWIWASGWYYADADGAMATGWRKVSGKWYYLDGANEEHPGLMVSGCEKEIGGKTYLFRADGSMWTGWNDTGGSWYYYDGAGVQQKGWVKLDGKWYYLDPENDNKMVGNQWKIINGNYYFFNGSGVMGQDWIYRGGWYYLGKDGAMRTGWQKIGLYWYYLYEENDSHGGTWGMMASNTKIDGWRVGRNGQYARAYDYAEKVLNTVGWNLRAAFNWSAGMQYESNTRNASPGSDYFATYGFQHYKGNCYVMATTFYYMADLLGYDVHWVDGYVGLRSGGRSPHSWCEIVIDGATYVFDPDFTNEIGRNGYQITYGTSGTYKYVGYHRMN